MRPLLSIFLLYYFNQLWHDFPGWPVKADLAEGRELAFIEINFNDRVPLPHNLLRESGGRIDGG